MQRNQQKNPYTIKSSSWSSHSLIREYLSRVGKGARVLDVGIGKGLVGKICQEFELSATGIEPVKDWAESALPYYRHIFQCTLEQAPEHALLGYDVIVLADVLEHMSEPMGSLKKLVCQQKNRCMYIVSVPNIANIWVRFSLLFGKFEYTDRGILDRTHLHFFTRASIVRFLSSCGLKVNRLQPTPIPLELVSPFYEKNPFGILGYKILNLLTKLFPTLLGYQFVIVAKAE